MREINGDRPCTVLERCIYFAKAFVDIIPDIFSLPIKYYYPENIIEGRSFFDAIFLTWLRDELKHYIKPQEINMIDIGCGYGYARKPLTLAGYSGTYLGVDIEDYSKAIHRDRYDFDSYFALGDIMQMDYGVIEDMKLSYSTLAETYYSIFCDEIFDLLITKVTLEHIENDIKVIELGDKISKFQVHLVPSSFAIFTHARHGYRRYTKRDIRRKFGKCKIIAMGGLFSFIHQIITSTIPIILLRINNSQYSERYRLLSNQTLVLLDRLCPVFPGVYLIIKED